MAVVFDPFTGQIIDTGNTAGGGEINTASNVGAGEGVFKQKVAEDLEFKSLVAGTNVSLISDADTITISSTDTGEVNTASNIGGGDGIFKQKTGTDLEFKSIVAGTNVSVVSGTDTLTINASDSGEVNTASNVGGGSGLFKQKTGVDLEFKTLVAGTNISFVDGPLLDTITINATGGGSGEVNTASNVGTGEGLFKQKVGTDLQFKSITAGENVSIVSGTDSVTISAQPTVTTLTLANNASNENVTGFLVDPLVKDGFTADIIIKRDSPTEIVNINPTGYPVFSDKIVEISDGSCIIYSKGSAIINKINADGTLNTTFQTNANQFSSPMFTAIYKVIDVTEDASNQVFAIFGSFDTFQSLSRNNVCFIDGNGNDISDLYLNFGNATGSGTGILGTVYSATKIKIPAAVAVGTWASSSRYGYLIQGVTAINGTLTSSQLIVVSNEQSGGYIEVPDGMGIYASARLLTPTDKSIGTCSFTYGTTTLPTINWSDSESFYFSRYSSSGPGASFDTVYVYDFVSPSQVSVAVSSSGYSPSPVIINTIEPSPDGSFVFFGGEFNQVNSTNMRSFAKIIVNSPTSFSLDTSFSPFYTLDPSAVVYKILSSASSVAVSGNLNAYPTYKNYVVYDYSGALNTSALSVVNNVFEFYYVLDFTPGIFLQNPPGSTYLYKYSAIAPVVYMTTVYGCYDEVSNEMKIQGYTKSAGPYTGVDFSMTAGGQLKYTSTDVSGGGPFTLKYKLQTM